MQSAATLGNRSRLTGTELLTFMDDIEKVVFLVTTPSELVIESVVLGAIVVDLDCDDRFTFRAEASSYSSRAEQTVLLLLAHHGTTSHTMQAQDKFHRPISPAPIVQISFSGVPAHPRTGELCRGCIGTPLTISYSNHSKPQDDCKKPSCHCCASNGKIQIQRNREYLRIRQHCRRQRNLLEHLTKNT